MANSEDKRTPQYGDPRYDELKQAMAKRDIKLMRDLLVKHADLDINFEDEQGNTPRRLNRIYGDSSISDDLHALSSKSEERKKADLKAKCIEKLKTDYKDPRYDELKEAMAKRDTKLIKEIFIKHPDLDVNFQDEHGYTPLRCIGFSSNMDLAEFLLAHPNIDVNFQHADGLSPLSSAAINKNVAFTKALLSHPNIKVNGKDNGGCPPFVYAYLRVDDLDLVGGNQIMKELMKHKDFDPNDDWGGNSIVALAANYHADVDVIKNMLQFPNIDMANLHQAFHLIIGKPNNTPILKMMVEHPSFDVNFVDKFKITFLEAVLTLDQKKEDRTSLIKALIDHRTFNKKTQNIKNLDHIASLSKDQRINDLLGASNW